MKKANQVISFLRRTHIQTRLVVILLFLSLVPTLFIGFYAYDVYTDSINAKVGASAQQNIALLSATLNTELERYAFYINSLSVLSSVQEFLAAPKSEDFKPDSVEVREIHQMVSNTTMQPIYLRNIRIADRNGVVVYDYGYDDVSEAHYREILRAVDLASPKDSLTYVRTFRSVDNLVLGRKIYRYPSANEHIGYILVYINEKLLSETIYPGISYGADSEILLVSGDGFVLSGKDHSALGKDIADTQLFRDMVASNARGETSFHSSFNGMDGLAVFSYNARYNCYFVATVPHSYIANETRHITQNLFIVAGILVLLSGVVAVAIYRSIMQPIRKITARCETISDDGIDHAINDDSPDELGFLARSIDGMIEALKDMASKSKQDQRRKRELELEMLRYQINPHFLFNTLNTLRWVAVMNEVPVLEEGISSLSSLLQSTLIHESELNTIEEEIKNLRHYFSIQRIRYGDSFDVRYELDESLLSCKIPRFILQPIAENSVIHGTNDGNRKVTIDIKLAAEANGDVVIELRDDGVGFEIREAIEQKKERFSGIGIQNVDERLQLYFGKAYGLKIHSEPNKGTLSVIVIPQKWLDEEGGQDV